jgi:hypothetical protein
MGWIRDSVLALFGQGPLKGFDPVFYGQYYRDLSGFDAKKRLEHFNRHGIKEGRAKNQIDLRNRLEALNGALPDDFDREAYKSINRSLPEYFRYDWEFDVHYIEIGREEGRRYKIGPRVDECGVRADPGRTIYVHRGDGMGSRLLSIIYAKILADILGYRVKVVWDNMRSPFYSSALFDPARLGEIFADSHVFHDGGERDGEICDHIPEHLRLFRLECDFGKCAKVSVDAFLNQLDAGGYEALFYGQPAPALAFMKYERDLRLEVRRVWKTMAWSAPISAFVERYAALSEVGDRIAVHVRRGDLVRMIVEADLDLLSENVIGIFIRYAALKSIVKQIEEVRTDEKILLCSDDEGMAARLKGEYGEANVCSSHDVDRLTENQRSVVDIVLLSKSKILVSPYLSLFSKCAAEVGECEHVAMPLDLSATVEELTAIADRRVDGRAAQAKALIYAGAATITNDEAMRETFLQQARRLDASSSPAQST